MAEAERKSPITPSDARSQIPPAAERKLSLAVSAPRSDQKQTEAQTRSFVIAWFFTVIFYFLEYAVRSTPSVMIPELATSFHTTLLGVGAILGSITTLTPQ